MAKPKAEPVVTPAQLAANDLQIGGQHYKSSFQHWDFVADVLAGRYMEGQITKYVSRWSKKNGVQDLHKAEHFLSKLLEQEEAGTAFQLADAVDPLDAKNIKLFCSTNQVGPVEEIIITAVSTWSTREDLLYALRTLHYLTTFLEDK